MKKILIFIALSFLFSTIFCQPADENNTPSEELITISKNTSFPVAVRAIETMSQKFEGRNIVNMSTFIQPIGSPIKKLYWKDALEVIVKFNNLVLEELPGAYVIKDFVVKKEIKPGEEKITTETKQIRISSIFFIADKSVLNSIGIDWSTFSNGKVVTSVNFSGGSRVTEDIINATGATSIQSGNVTIDINTLMKIMESEQKGTVIARPSVVVMSGKKGYIQVGKDFSVKTRDQAGNISDKFFTTGIILEVSPTIIEDSLRKAIYLVAKVEKSSAVPGEITTIINKSQSTTEVLLFDGEETIIGGLCDIEDTRARAGIPFLKDLPWWVFGIRYLTGYDKHDKAEKEMIVIIKAKIIKPIEQREKEDISTKKKIQEIRKSRAYIDTLFIEGKKDKNESKKTKVEQ